MVLFRQSGEYFQVQSERWYLYWSFSHTHFQRVRMVSHDARKLNSQRFRFTWHTQTNLSSLLDTSFAKSFFISTTITIIISESDFWPEAESRFGGKKFVYCSQALYVYGMTVLWIFHYIILFIARLLLLISLLTFRLLFVCLTTGTSPSMIVEVLLCSRITLVLETWPTPWSVTSVSSGINWENRNIYFAA